ncbi:MAG: argininosuccinate synthase [Pseudomonadota bacterium]
MDHPIVLAFSGGLDTSFLIPYLKKKTGSPVVAVHVDTGGSTREQLDAIARRAKELGALEIRIVDAKKTYFADVISYLIKGNILRGEVYPLCVGAERVTQARELVKVARDLNARQVAHGSTAAGNDQVRFEIYFRVLAPEMEILAPVRDEKLTRKIEVDYMNAHGFPVSAEKARYSINRGLWGTTIGAREFQDPACPIPEEAYRPVTSTESKTIRIGFESGIPVSLDGKRLDPVSLIEKVSELAYPLGIGRGIHLGNTVVGIKGRIAFEAPAAAVLLPAHRELEKLVTTKWQTFWKRELSQFYGDLLHEGHYFDPVLRDIEAYLDRSQERVTGSVLVKLAPFRCQVEGCESNFSMTGGSLGVYGEEALSWTGEEARGFAKLNSIPAQLWHGAERKS